VNLWYGSGPPTVQVPTRFIVYRAVHKHIQPASPYLIMIGKAANDKCWWCSSSESGHQAHLGPGSGRAPNGRARTENPESMKRPDKDRKAGRTRKHRTEDIRHALEYIAVKKSAQRPLEIRT
jgi:hypothetical protein